MRNTAHKLAIRGNAASISSVIWKCVLLFEKKVCSVVNWFQVVCFHNSMMQQRRIRLTCRIVLGPEAHNIRASGWARSHCQPIWVGMGLSSRTIYGPFACVRAKTLFANWNAYSLRPKILVILRFKICPKKQVTLPYLESACECKNQLVSNMDNI